MYHVRYNPCYNNICKFTGDMANELYKFILFIYLSKLYSRYWKCPSDFVAVNNLIISVFHLLQASCDIQTDSVPPPQKKKNKK